MQHGQKYLRRNESNNFVFHYYFRKGRFAYMVVATDIAAQDIRYSGEIGEAQLCALLLKQIGFANDGGVGGPSTVCHSQVDAWLWSFFRRVEFLQCLDCFNCNIVKRFNCRLGDRVQTIWAAAPYNR